MTHAQGQNLPDDGFTTAVRRTSALRPVLRHLEIRNERVRVPAPPPADLSE